MMASVRMFVCKFRGRGMESGFYYIFQLVYSLVVGGGGRKFSKRSLNFIKNGQKGIKTLIPKNSKSSEIGSDYRNVLKIKKV